MARFRIPYRLCWLIGIALLANTISTSAQTNNEQKGKQVTLYVTVKTKSNLVVTDLRQENFKLFEGKVAKPILSFSSSEEPASVCFMFDRSGSMVNSAGIPIPEVFTAFASKLHRQSEYFVLTFAKSTKVEPLDSDPKVMLRQLQRVITDQPIENSTSLFDVIKSGSATLQKAKFGKKVLILLTDLEDNGSKFGIDTIERLLVKDSTALLFMLTTRIPKKEKHFSDYSVFSTHSEALMDIASKTGGATFFLKNLQGVPDSLTMVAARLKGQYQIAFEPSPSKKSSADEWRRIDVRVSPPDNLKNKISVATRSGYYATTQN